MEVHRLHLCPLGTWRREKLKEFIELLNEKHPTIKSTAKWYQTSINFFDVTVSLIGGKVATDLYVKPSDSHHYLHSSSCHSYHCKKAIPYSEVLFLIESVQVLILLTEDAMIMKSG